MPTSDIALLDVHDRLRSGTATIPTGPRTPQIQSLVKSRVTLKWSCQLLAQMVTLRYLHGRSWEGAPGLEPMYEVTEVGD